MAKTHKQIIGDLGEGVTCNYLKNRGFKIIKRNYLKKWGELDIVAVQKGKFHFIEVKTISRKIFNFEIEKEISFRGTYYKKDVSCKTSKDVIRETDEYRAEDNLHSWKLKRLARAIKSYLLDKNTKEEVEWQFDVAIIYLDVDKRLAKIKYMEDLII